MPWTASLEEAVENVRGPDDVPSCDAPALFRNPSPLLLLHVQPLERFDDVFAGRLRTDFLVDFEDLPIGTDIEGPAAREARGGQNAVRGRDLLLGIGEDGIVGLDGFGELAICIRVVDAGGEVGDVEGLEGGAALTERPAFGRSSTGKRFGEPGEYDGLPFVVCEPVNLAIGTRQRKRGSRIAHLKFDCLRHATSGPEDDRRQRAHGDAGGGPE